MDRIVDVEQISFEDDKEQITLRPSSWNNYIGQEKIKKKPKSIHRS